MNIILIETWNISIIIFSIIIVARHDALNWIKTSSTRTPSNNRRPQIPAVLAAAGTVGSSSTFMTVVSQLLATQPLRDRFAHLESFRASPAMRRAVAYILSAALGAFAAARAGGTFAAAAGVPPGPAFVGGFLMLFGSRSARLLAEREGGREREGVGGREGGRERERAREGEREREVGREEGREIEQTRENSEREGVDKRK
jgi:hypothetical protein